MDEELKVALAARLSWFAPTYTMDACQIEADAILALFTSYLVKAQREAFTEGAYACTDEGLPLRIKEAREEAARRYPDV